MTGGDAGAGGDGGAGSDSGTPNDAGSGVDSGTANDAGTPNDAGSGVDSGTPSDAGSGSDAGLDGGSAVDGGFMFDASLPPDSGFAEYTGQAEDGVVCDQTTCGVGVSCCLTPNFQTFEVDGTCSAAQNGSCMVGNEIACDGVEDCNGQSGEVCCISNLDNALQVFTQCRQASQCVDQVGGAGEARDTICVTTADCAVSEVCCGFTGVDLPTEFGVCSDVCS